VGGRTHGFPDQMESMYVTVYLTAGGMKDLYVLSTQLYSYGPNPPEHYARLRVTNESSNVILEITSESFQAGLFEPCIISALLLFSKRNID